MSDYKRMYLTLYETIQLTVHLLNKALEDCEKIAFDAPQPNFIRLPLSCEEEEQEEQKKPE